MVTLGGRQPIFTRSLVFCVVFCRPLFNPCVLCLLVIVLSVLLLFIGCDYHFGFFKLFLINTFQNIEPGRVIMQVCDITIICNKYFNISFYYYVCRSSEVWTVQACSIRVTQSYFLMKPSYLSLKNVVIYVTVNITSLCTRRWYTSKPYFTVKSI